MKPMLLERDVRFYEGVKYRANRCRLPVATLLYALLFSPLATAQPLVEKTAELGQHGGDLVASLRAEPRTFNPVTAIDNPSLTVLRRMHADLVHIDRRSHEAKPALATDWVVSEDGRQYELTLRRDVRFSDGHPFDAADVVFTFEALLDERNNSPYAELLRPGGEPIRVEKLDSHRLRFHLAASYAAGERLFDSLPILPRHKLEAAQREGRLSEEWSTATSPADIVGLGPFMLQQYAPGQRLVLVRNPHYWKVDRQDRRLPYLERLVFEVGANPSAEVLRFKAGEIHVLDRISHSSFEALERASSGARIALHDLGPGLQYSFLLLNLNQLTGKPELERKQRWWRDVKFRRGLSAAVDRSAIVRLVYGGRGEPLATHVTPGLGAWHDKSLKPVAREPGKARGFFQRAGFTWDKDGRMHDAAGKPVQLTLLVSSSNQPRRDIAQVVQEDLRQLGIDVRLATLEFRALLERVLKTFDYEMVVLSMGGGDADPNGSIPLLTSTGQNHLWQLESGGKLPPWQVEIDELMQEQLIELDPKRRLAAYHRVQGLVAENLPMIFLASPNVLVGSARGLGNFRPAVLDHSTLWNVDVLFWQPRGK